MIQSTLRFGVYSDPGALFTLKQAAINTEDPRFIQVKEATKARLNPYFDRLADYLLINSLDALSQDVKQDSNTSLLLPQADAFERLAAYQVAEAALTKRIHQTAKPPKGGSSQVFADAQAKLNNVARLLGKAPHLVVRPEDNLFRVLKISIERVAYGLRAAQLSEAQALSQMTATASMPTPMPTPVVSP